MLVRQAIREPQLRARTSATPSQPTDRVPTAAGERVDRRGPEMQQVADLSGGHHHPPNRESSPDAARSRRLGDLWSRWRHGEHHAPQAQPPQPQLRTSSRRLGTTSDNFVGRAKKPLHTLLLRLAHAGAGMGSEKVRQAILIAVAEDVGRVNKVVQRWLSADRPADREAAGPLARSCLTRWRTARRRAPAAPRRRPLPTADSRPTRPSSWSAPAQSAAG